MKQSIAIPQPDWLKDIADEDIRDAVFAFIASIQIAGSYKITNLRKELSETYTNLSESQIEELAKILIAHKVVE